MDNPDAAFMQAFAADPSPRPMTTNPLLDMLKAELLDYDKAARVLTMRFSPPPVVRQGAGMIQGGIIGAMLDFAMVLPAFATLGPRATVATTTMTISYFGPGTADSFRVVGRIEKAGRRMIFASATLHEAERKIAAASSSLLVVPHGAE